ncbi:diphosphomevalonate/mevalonate 3,5-bisphosphate decarboxylase family protein [Lutimonas zeaxanthinifaciens]|uniref:diphosphomevalonate/mevalonate 3,5-bisphosphate decarboxylase family protein n=1 Tax=Lutimonas zeaxanthinifaciens TaxID=3060215 RepID=UPI00265CFDF8|nr:diphosphomevalonate decarboxylase [Lutimonas sp. YSD2104]WKK66226.1 diphosphomevalonate decarboxylase [Lutimonas sp. YSD2104]
MEKNFIFNLSSEDTKASGSVTWQSPSNIALIKYWGKTDPQIPKNVSVSFTLSNCNTQTTVRYSPKMSSSDGFDFKVFFDEKENQNFRPKIEQFFERVVEYVPFIRNFQFEIHTENSFPHSSGIASSASGMSALALCLMSIQKSIDPQLSESEFNQKASFLARLGSGSAARSIEGPVVVWGQHPSVYKSNDLYGTKYSGEIHDVFTSFHDTILLVDKGEKKVSSTLGHKLMLGHPFAESRFEQAKDNMSRLIAILKNGELDSFIDVVEREALSLHAMMMTSDPYFILMKPNTLEIINRIWNFRKLSGFHICFTLDAGANVHVLYPDKDKNAAVEFIKKELVSFCQNGQFIEDTVGNGAKLLH